MEGPWREESTEEIDSSRLLLVDVFELEGLLLVGVRGEKDGGCNGISDGKSAVVIAAEAAVTFLAVCLFLR
eukprot:scaffold24845_cov89-Skeletonema_dohrnii-CCMP3373.AAC.1